MNEPILIYIIKKYLWEFVLGAICLTMIQSALENIGGDARWVIVAKGVVNGLYASVFFGGIGGYYFNEIGIVGGILVGTAVGFAGVKELAAIVFDVIKSKYDTNK